MGNASSTLPFIVGDEVKCYPENCDGFWRLHKGTKRAGGQPVSIFRVTFKDCPPHVVEGGRHAFQKTRTLRHPNVLSCLDGIELETEIVMATGKTRRKAGAGASAEYLHNP
ncbi:unnamed protein product [Discosporangium mesarthrocarpum]